MVTDVSSTPQTSLASAKRPRSKDDTSQVVKRKQKVHLFVLFVMKLAIKEPTKNKRVMKPFILRVTVMHGFTVDVLVCRHQIC